MNAKDPGSLGLIVAGGGEDLLDVVIFERAESQELVSGGRNVVFRKCFAGFFLVMLVANFFREMAGVNLTLGAENHGALDYVS
jgi:hypothetical protein